MTRLTIRNSTVILFLMHLLLGVSFGQGTAFTYQGKLADGGSPASGNYDFELRLFDTATVGTGTQQGGTLQRLNVVVANGVFTVSLDFGVCASCFNGADRFLEIRVKQTSGGVFATLGPRQPINATPYALKTLNAASADGLSVTCVNCVTSNQIQSVQGSQVTGTINVASVPAGSASYIQNGTGPQASSNFNISGNGTAGGMLSAPIVNVTTHYSVGGVRIFSANGPYEGSGIPTASNTFAGDNAGINTTPNPSIFTFEGKFNSFFGLKAGRDNTLGMFNSFFGFFTGLANTTGSNNSFFGSRAGENNTANLNSFFGDSAGSGNTSGDRNAFFGESSGKVNSTGIENSFFGSDSGTANQSGSNNSMVGADTGFTSTNSTGNGNTLLGSTSRALANVSNATAIGYRARVDQSNSLVLGAIAGVNGASISPNVGIGTTTPATSLHVASGSSGAAPNANASMIVERNTGHFVNILGTDAVQTGILFGKPTGGGSVAGIVFNSVGSPDGLQFRTGGNNTQMSINSSGSVGIGTNSPNDQLQVIGDIRVGTGSTGCVKDADGTVIAGSCSSDARLKRDVTPFSNVLEKLIRLQPVHFYWRTEQFPEKHFGSSQSFGLIAQEVERVMPELVGEDQHGYKVVRYAKLPLLMLQAIKDLKIENDELKKELSAMRSLRDEIFVLKKLMCVDHPDSAVCQSRK